MKLGVLVSAAVTTVLLAGCTDHGKPILDSTPQVSQPQFNSTQQWKGLAEDFATDLAKRMGDNSVEPRTAAANGIISVPLLPPTAAVYVREDQVNRSAFAIGYREMLKTRLTQRGYRVLDQDPERSGSPELAASTVYISADAQVVMMGHQRDTGLERFVFAWTETPNCEVIVTTSAEKNGQFLFRDTHIAYVDDSQGKKYYLAPSTVTVRTLPLTAN